MKSLAQIAAELQGYDPQSLPAGSVNEFLSQLVEPVGETEDVGLFEALGRVLAQDIISPFSVPPHDNSAMDGYAFDSSQLRGGVPLTLEVVGTALAGKAWKGEVANVPAAQQSMLTACPAIIMSLQLRMICCNFGTSKFSNVASPVGPNPDFHEPSRHRSLTTRINGRPGCNA